MKVLVLGTNSSSTDELTNELAQQANSVNHGLLEQHALKDYSQPGFYHTAVNVDMSIGTIMHIAPEFDKVIMLDQPIPEWSHNKILLSTYKLMQHLEKTGQDVEYKNNQNIRGIAYFTNLLEENKSFCLYPWMLSCGEHGTVDLCNRSDKKLSDTKTVEWNIPERLAVQEKMLAGEKIPDYCKLCYYYEDRGVESSRIFETMDWVAKLELQDLDDLKSRITDPHYYEIRLDNHCNLKCRICTPRYSHLLNREFKDIGVTVYTTKENDSDFPEYGLEHVNISKLTPQHRVYVAGGEPTFNYKFFDFLEECVAQGKTDFDLCIGTNGMIASTRLMNLLNQFSNVTFSVSMDGYGKINDYIRAPSNFEKIMKNARTFVDAGHNISFNSVVGLYNVTNYHLLFEYIDEHFPNTPAYLQLNYNDMQDPYNYPIPEIAVKSLERCTKTAVYYNDSRGCKTMIDSLLEYYKNGGGYSKEKLQRFFDFNDKLDESRSEKLADVIPELEMAREYI